MIDITRNAGTLKAETACPARAKMRNVDDDLCNGQI